MGPEIPCFDVDIDMNKQKRELKIEWVFF